MSGPAWAALGLALSLAGLLVLARLRPARGGLTSPQWMLLLGAVGMGIGLLLDARSGGLELLASLCTGPTDLAGMLSLHLTHLPPGHLGMLAGGLVANVALVQAVIRLSYGRAPHAHGGP
jgi:hypothetical protein